MSLLPEQLQAMPGRTYQLRVTVGGQVFTVDDLRQGVVVVGGPEELLKKLIDQESASDRQAGLEDCLMFSGVSRNEMMSKWKSGEKLLPSPIFGADETIVVEVQDLNSMRIWSKTAIQVASLSTGNINTQCLEVKM